MQQENTSRAIVPYLRQFNDEEKALIGALLAQVAPKANNQEKALFLYTAQKKGLDPFDRQIYLVPRWDSQSNSLKHSVQVSIDGLRLMAQRSGKYAGQTPYEWCGKDGKWVDVWVADEHPVAARVGIYRHDFKEPLYSVALFKSYKQTKKDGSLTVFWEKYDTQMLAKCAEALSIRRGFPEETSGFYIPEEMGNPELTYVSEVEQDDNAPLVASEVVDPSHNNGSTHQPTNRSNVPPTNRATGRPTQSATNPVPTPKTAQPPETKKSEVALADIPSVSQLKKDVAELKPSIKGVAMDWQAVLGYVFKADIASGKTTLEKLVEAGNELGPDECAKLYGFVQQIKASRDKQNGNSGK